MMHKSSPRVDFGPGCLLMPDKCLGGGQSVNPALLTQGYHMLFEAPHPSRPGTPVGSPETCHVLRDRYRLHLDGVLLPVGAMQL
eukprot:CAMPEP_0119112822 /NCGR_PEP_ID=MMETSP1180-20130426/41816_1 /TAXON_ID=3052 ORGANISM="Chlamydomonas cf sp, Strain CCMP681" /NCGR_SAMPLE_ID=MMETSP1180 /ASSEMBLY_ACC=CAM_ASM_000741 /LENGTH=83 /DNA_ID=CAMNT_0007100539 /DNA_START=148 /DNA_END=400 /DNA_ORIENTATION=+